MSTMTGIQKRADGLRDLLQREHPEIFTEQKHTDADSSPEKWYWHHGYMMGIYDALGSLDSLTGEAATRRDELKDNLVGFPRP